MSTYSSLVDWILTANNMPKINDNKNTYKVVILGAVYTKKEEQECLMFKVTDGIYSLPMLVYTNKARDIVSLDVLPTTIPKDFSMDFFHNTLVEVTRSGVTAWNRDGTAYPLIIALEWHCDIYAPKQPPPPSLQDIHTDIKFRQFKAPLPRDDSEYQKARDSSGFAFKKFELSETQGAITSVANLMYKNQVGGYSEPEENKAVMPSSTTSSKWKGKEKEISSASSSTTTTITTKRSKFEFKAAQPPSFLLSSSASTSNQLTTTTTTTAISQINQAEENSRLSKVRLLFKKLDEAGLHNAPYMLEPQQQEDLRKRLSENVDTSDNKQTKKESEKSTQQTTTATKRRIESEGSESSTEMTVKKKKKVKQEEQEATSSIAMVTKKRKKAEQVEQEEAETETSTATALVVKKKKKKIKKDKKKKPAVEEAEEEKIRDTYASSLPPKHPKGKHGLQQREIMDAPEASFYEKRMALGRFKRLMYFSNSEFEIEAL